MFFSFSGFHHNKFVYRVNVSSLKLPLVTYTPEARSWAIITSTQLFHLIFKSHLKTQILIWKPQQELLLSSGPLTRSTTGKISPQHGRNDPWQCRLTSAENAKQSVLLFLSSSWRIPVLTLPEWSTVDEWWSPPVCWWIIDPLRDELLKEYQGLKQGLWLFAFPL